MFMSPTNFSRLFRNGRRAAEPLGGPTTLLSEPPAPDFKFRTDGKLDGKKDAPAAAPAK